MTEDDAVTRQWEAEKTPPPTGPEEIVTARVLCRRCAWEALTDCTGLASSAIPAVMDDLRQQLRRHSEKAHP